MTEESIKEYLMDWTGLNGHSIGILVEGLTEKQRMILLDAVCTARDDAYEEGLYQGKIADIISHSNEG